MRAKNLLIRKPEGGLAAVLPSFGLAFAVFAAAGMAAAGCDSLTGMGGDESASAEISAPAPGSAGGPAFASASGLKTIKVNFEVKNGGWGLLKSQGIVSKQDDSYLVSDGWVFDSHFDIGIIVPVSEKYLNIRWKATDIWWRCTYLTARLQLGDGSGSYNIGLDYNGRGKVATKNLSDVVVNKKDVGGDFDKALARARVTKTPVDELRTVTVKFEVQTGGYGLDTSKGIISPQDDSYFIYDFDIGAQDFTITVPVPETDEYMNIRWRAVDWLAGDTYVKAKMKAEDGTIALDYNGKGKVSAKNLYYVTVGTNADMKKDFDDALDHAVQDYALND